ncbi:ABC transporter permease [Aliiroseovarius subalbicans]|uniref:ABC transporter permease n=1 Tax=Aliiroseovarius subalbicans TaxID=2925840 RepID=UPI001F58A14A|nr:ABC transporter permease [Aliiroseovarius subalbicans]MCI2399801.1 ABC transporter permease [Aliiroseovarius subalbicans]
MNTNTPLKAIPHKTGRTILALMLREMSSTYGRSVAGYFWALAEPVGGIAMMTILFSLALTAPALGDNFPLYYASGFLPFILYSELANKAGQSVRFSKPLLFYPGVTYIDAILARVTLNALTQIMVFVIVVATIIVGFQIDVILDVPAIATAFAMALALALGIGTLNCYLNWRLPSWERIWVIINRPLFLMSCVFFNFETVPQPFQDYLWFNPLIHVVGQMRRGIYATYDAEYVSLSYCFGLAGLCLLFGLLLLGRYHRDIVNG